MKNRKYKQKKLSIKIKILIIVAFVSIIAVLLDRQMRPLIKSVVFSQAQTVSTNVINQVVADELSRLDIDYSDIIDIQKDADGKILAVSTDMKKVNSLKSLMTLSIQDKISAMEVQKTKIPLGTFTGTEILNGRGPKIPIDVSMSGSVIMDFKSEFVSAGINQTKHKLYLEVNSEVLAFIPGYPVNTVVKTSILIAETIIVGEVPAVFAENTH
ncbi:sporulation protein YunB [Clostridium sp. CAG:557]|nr:sporulation protein YunB [Clostridium sp. CAG:557]